MSEQYNNDQQILWFDDFAEPGQERNGYRFLSNFYVGEPIVLDGWEFMTGEHAFQAYKATDREQFRLVRDALSPGSAKSYGRTIELRKDWETVKYDVMAAVLRAKFTLNRKEGGLLLDTGDRLLVEGTYWFDTVWGTRLDAPFRDGLPRGRNWLGTLLMARRAELRAERLLGAGAVTPTWNVGFARGAW